MSRIYSQWDWKTLRYNYFVGSEPADPGGFSKLQGIRHDTPPSGRGSFVGVDLDDVLRSLPADARFIGVGDRARGEIVKSRGVSSPALSRPNRGLGSDGEVLIEPLLDEMAAASGGTKSHPGVTVEALDNPGFAIAVTAGMTLGFGLGRAFGSQGRMWGWLAAGILGLVTAGARREAFVKMIRQEKK